LEQAERQPDPLTDHLQLVARLDDPVDDLRVAAVLDVVEAARAALGLVGNPNRARDHGAVAGVDDPRPPRLAVLGALDREHADVAVAAELAAEPATEPGKRLPVLEQQVRRAERA